MRTRLALLAAAVTTVWLAPTADAGKLNPQDIDLTLQIVAAPTTAAEGATVTFTISIDNNGPNDATNTQLDVLFPATLDTLTVTSSAPYTCGPPSAGQVLCTLATHPVDILAEIVVTARVVPGSVINGQAIVVTGEVGALVDNETNPANNEATATVTASVPTTTTSTTTTTLAPTTTTAAPTTTTIAGGAQPPATTAVISIPETGNSAPGNWLLAATVFLAIGLAAALFARDKRAKSV